MRRLPILAVPVALVLVTTGCSSGGDGPAEGAAGPSTSSSAPATTAAPYRSEVYADAANWLCRPESTDDACDVDLDAVLLAADGTRQVQPFTPATDPEADCFYVYPTISTDTGANSDLVPGDAERNIVSNQFARFAEACRLFAPVYRQVPLAGIGLGGGGTTTTAAPGAPEPREVAYADVADAWRHYLANDNDGRPVVLVGHSQGAGHLTRLIAEEIDDDEAVRSQLVSAMLIGAGVPAPGTDGAFENVPPCERTGDAVPTGCVVSYATYLDTEPPPEGSFFGQTRGGGRAICTNPATLTDRTGPLTTYLPRPDAVDPSVLWTRYEGLYDAVCVADERDWLKVTNTAGEGDARPADVGGRITPVWGLHLLDVNLAMGDLVELAKEQVAAR